jgi:hypothetical protein
LHGGFRTWIPYRNPLFAFSDASRSVRVPHPARSAVELARAIADALEAAELPYAVGGALALAYYAPPRATVDVDVNVFVPPRGGVEPVVKALRSVGFEPDEPPEALNARASRDGQFRGHCEGMRVDVFVPAIDYYAELERRRRVVQTSSMTWPGRPSLADAR